MHVLNVIVYVVNDWHIVTLLRVLIKFVLLGEDLAIMTILMPKNMAKEDCSV